jgi:hypothetical protein
MNSKGHTITSIYMSGGQAKNILMMKLFANTCDMPVVLPHSHSLAVVLGAAMLGRFADEVSRQKLEKDQIGEKLWKIMVSFSFFSLRFYFIVDKLLMLMGFLGRDDTPWDSNCTRTIYKGEKTPRGQV